MFFIQKEYVKYIAKSTNHHGVHSPFVFDFVTKCVYKKKLKSEQNSYKRYTSSLKSSEEDIEIQDFGAGSRVFKNNTRRVSDIARIAGVKKKYGLLLMRIVSYFEFNKCLEIGTSLGTATFCIKNKQPSLSLTTLEGCKNTISVAKNTLKNFGVTGIEFILGDFKDSLPSVLNGREFDMIYFDGNHTKDATLQYFNLCLASKHNDSVFIFDDIYWNAEMKEAWNVIKLHHEVTVTIDLFQWGIVFFRKEQKKEHFIIRF